MIKLTNMSLTTRGIQSATLSLLLLFVVACSNQAPLTQPLVNTKLENTDALSEKPASESQKESTEELSSLSSADLSSELLNHISTASDTSIASLSSSNFQLNSNKDKCGFVVASASLNDSFKKQVESRGWLNAAKPNHFKLKVDDGSRTYQQCRCLAVSLSATAGVALVPILNP